MSIHCVMRRCHGSMSSVFVWCCARRAGTLVAAVGRIRIPDRVKVLGRINSEVLASPEFCLCSPTPTRKTAAPMHPDWWCVRLFTRMVCQHSDRRIRVPGRVTALGRINSDVLALPEFCLYIPRCLETCMLVCLDSVRRLFACLFVCLFAFVCLFVCLFV